MISSTKQELGFDASDDNKSVITGAKFTCLKNEGFKFAILKGYRSNNTVFENAPQNIKNAIDNGF